jgi:hypothetical protein
LFVLLLSDKICRHRFSPLNTKELFPGLCRAIYKEIL